MSAASKLAVPHTAASAGADFATTRYRLAIRDAMTEEMQRDPKVLLMGQDIGASGGLFKLTEGLFERFGAQRVRDTPISETATVGAAIGLAMLGFRPVVEIAFSDLMASCFDTVVNQLAKIPYMFGPQVPHLPVVIRAMTGAGIGAGAHHSQSLETWFAHTPGLKVVMPGTPRDAKALLKAAIRDDGPVIFLEHKALLRDSGPVPLHDEVGTIGKAAVVREGRDVTLVGYSGTLKTVLSAADQLATSGFSAEVIDLRSISPLDTRTILASVLKTGRLVVVHEAHSPMGVGAEILAQISAQAFEKLKAPMERVTAPHVPIPANKALEAFYLPSVDAVVRAADRALRHGSARV